MMIHVKPFILSRRNSLEGKVRKGLALAQFIPQRFLGSLLAGGQGASTRNLSGTANTCTAFGLLMPSIP